MSEFLQFAFSGITVGVIYAIVALGFTVIYNASHVVNFAQGEFVMLGAMFTVFGIAIGLPYPVAAFVAVVLTAIVSVALFDLAIRPARNAPIFALIIITIGASILLRGLARVSFGTSFFSLPPILGDAPIQISGAILQRQSLVVIGVVGIMLAGLWLMMNKTLLGKALVAVSNDQLASRLSGINVRSIIRLSFAVSAAIGAVGGIVITPIALASYDMGTLLALKGFAAAMLGGMGSPAGAIVGGLLVGLTESFSAGYLSSDYKDAMAFIIIFLVLFIFPGGLFGKETHERV